MLTLDKMHTEKSQKINIYALKKSNCILLGFYLGKVIENTVDTVF